MNNNNNNIIILDLNLNLQEVFIENITKDQDLYLVAAVLKPRKIKIRKSLKLKYKNNIL